MGPPHNVPRLVCMSTAPGMTLDMIPHPPHRKAGYPRVCMGVVWLVGHGGLGSSVLRVCVGIALCMSVELARRGECRPLEQQVSSHACCWEGYPAFLIGYPAFLII